MSDDRKFLGILQLQRIPYMTPAALVVVLCEKKILTVPNAENALLGLRGSIRNEQYQAALADLDLLERS